jgi:hypothetical protein
LRIRRDVSHDEALGLRNWRRKKGNFNPGSEYCESARKKYLLDGGKVTTLPPPPGRGFDD